MCPGVGKVFQAIFSLFNVHMFPVSYNQNKNSIGMPHL